MRAQRCGGLLKIAGIEAEWKGQKLAEPAFGV
jgi:hypothetical protein